MTVDTFLRSVLRLINVLGGGAGEIPTDEEYADALEGLNGLVNEWQSSKPAIFTIKNYTHALTANQGTYTIGAGQQLDTPRPTKITDASILHSNGIRTPLKLVGKTEWNAIISPNAVDVVPLTAYCDYDYPAAKLYLHPVPSGTPTLNLFMWHELTNPLGLDDDLAFPPTYENAFRFNLAIDLAMQWGRPVSDDLRRRAAETKAELGMLNESNEEAVEALAPAPPAQQQ